MSENLWLFSLLAIVVLLILLLILRQQKYTHLHQELSKTTQDYNQLASKFDELSRIKNQLEQQTIKAQKSLDSLKKMSSPKCKVIRDHEQLEKIGSENYQDYLINWISIAYLRMLTKIHDFLINYYNLTLEKGLKIDDVMLVLIDILDTEVKDFPKGLKKSIEVGKETAGKCFFINKVIQPVPLTPELTLLLQGKDAYNIVPKI